MEYLDIYDEQGNYLGKEDRNIVHKKALWHNTVHCWLYDNEGNIFFQIRSDENKFYTTASGHIHAGETIKEGFGREVKEEIGTNIDYTKAELVSVVKFKLDRKNADGSVFRDRAFANVYVCLFDLSYDTFNFDNEEVDGLVKVQANKVLSLFNNEIQQVEATIIKDKNKKIVTEKTLISSNDFLVNNGETAMGKYGEILKKVVEITKNNKK